MKFMQSRSLHLSTVPLLSRIEHYEMVRKLPFTRRMVYYALSALAVMLVFVVLAGGSTLIVSAVWGAVIGKTLTIGDMVMMAMPVVFALMFSIGLSGSPMPNHVVPGTTLLDAVRRSARRGLVNGMITGFMFSIVWSLAINLSRLYAHIVTIYESYIPVDEILLQSFIMMIVVGVAFALFRSFTCLNGYFILKRLRNTN